VSADLDSAREFVLGNARLLDRHRLSFRFDDAPAGAVLAALRAYQNEDGGFGHALEPDLRGPSSQPVPLEHALRILDAIDAFEPELVGSSVDWLASVTTPEGGVPFVLPTVNEAPHAPWWVPTGEASLNPTAGIVGLLHKRAVRHAWVDSATEYCWEALSRTTDDLGADDAISVLTFLEHVPDRDRAEDAFEQLGTRIRRDLVALDPSTPGYVKSPLEFAPRPESLARPLFDAPTIELHLDSLAARQEGDGGWPITWDPPTAAAIGEWRGFMTVMWLEVLDSYGRLSRI
jgi:hypothetical protein